QRLPHNCERTDVTQGRFDPATHQGTSSRVEVVQLTSAQMRCNPPIQRCRGSNEERIAKEARNVLGQRKVDNSTSSAEAPQQPCERAQSEHRVPHVPGSHTSLAVVARI